jgi:MoxR-like ATPase
MELMKNIDEAKNMLDSWIQALSSVLIGKEQPIRLIIASFLARGHVLLEDVPGTGKTLLSKAMAKSLGLAFSRIQFTPDLLPTDITGLSLFDRSQQLFQFRPGPLFSDIILADEVNRATPRTQSAMLEAMAEGQVTVDGSTHQLSPFFFVMATENPIDYEGTFPLPEAQLDRFLIRLDLGYPDEEAEKDILSAYQTQNPLHKLQSLYKAEDLIALLRMVDTVTVSPEVQSYIVRLVRASRVHPRVVLGVSPRGSLALQRLAMSWAFLQGRSFVLPDDVKALAIPALSHRLLLSTEARIKREKPIDILKELLDQVAVVSA